MGSMSVGAREWWQRFHSMPDAQRARLLALVLGCLVLGILYGLGGLSLYLRGTYLAQTPTRLRVTELAADAAPELGVTLVATGAAERAVITAAPTLFPTMTPNLTRTARAAIVPSAREGAALAPYYTPTPFPTPTAGPATAAATPTTARTSTPEVVAAPTRAFR
jgi:hypothetical protein